MPPPGSPQVGNWVSGLESSTPSSPIGGGLGRRGGPRGRLDDSEESLSSGGGRDSGACPSNGCGNWLLLVTTTALLALTVLLVASFLQLIMASGHPHNNYINNGGLIPIPQISIETIVQKVAGWFGRTADDPDRPFHQHPMDGNNIPDDSNEDSRRYLQDRRLLTNPSIPPPPNPDGTNGQDDNGDDDPPEGSDEEPTDPEDDGDDSDDQKKNNNNGSNEADGDDADDDGGGGRHGGDRSHIGGKSNSRGSHLHNPPFGIGGGITTFRPRHGFNSHNDNGHDHQEHGGGQNNPWRPRTTKPSPIDEIRKINNEDGWKAPGRPYPPVRPYPPHSGREFHETTSSSTSTTRTPYTTAGYNGLRNQSAPNTSTMRELWCHVYANAGLRDDQLRTLSEHCSYLLVDGEVHLQGTGLMPKVMSDAQILNRIRGAMPSSVKILLATKDFDSGFDKLLEVDDAEPGVGIGAGVAVSAGIDDDALRSRAGVSGGSLSPGGGLASGAISPKRVQAFDAVIGLLKRYQVQGLALRELENAKHYNLNQADKGERAQLRARWAALYVQLAEYLAEKGFEHAFLVKPSLERYREYSLRNIVNEGLGPVLLTSGALRAATSTLCVSPFKWMRDKRVITQTKVLKEAKDYFGKTWKRNLVFAVAPFVTNCHVYNKTAVYNCTRSYYSEFCKHASRGMLIEGTMRYGAESDCFSAQTRQDDGQVILWTGMGPMSGQFIRGLGQSRGLMMYNAFADDKEGHCGFGEFPLLKAVHDALQGKHDSAVTSGSRAGHN